MMPIDTFRYVKNNQTSRDLDNLTQLYQPIIGNDAQVLYLYFQSFFDNGDYDHKITDILNHLQFGIPRLNEALDFLMAMSLVELYQTVEGVYLVKLCSPLDRERFLAHAVYRKLLEDRIGELAVKELEYVLPKDALNRSKRFSDIFGHVEKSASAKPLVRSTVQFDLESFKRLMQRDGLYFQSEQTDVVTLYSISERYQLNWFDTYQLAKKTAIDGEIAPKRMEKDCQKGSLKTNETNFTDSEQTLIREAKSSAALPFLEKIKQTRRAVVTSSEKQLLNELATMNFLDEVINVMTLYTLNKTKSANLNKPYLMKVANDFSYQKITTAEEAVLKMRSFTNYKKTNSKKQKTKVKTNVPTWSNPDFKEKTTPEMRAELDSQKQGLLEKLRKAGE
ncbi:DnaD domain protein [Streptococcus sciuri]|uniref:DnaD domain protein n=1 Tax=Streptococcus sciuri TaxID=2973939 RepID=A0ABT2F8V4_9STRE|nr:DnaD domain protein [Streptococcus sciuri]MCS4488854.1 DnaD domain protein [Streptococcus sciuri]